MRPKPQLLSLLIAGTCQAQVFTNGTVYDYSVGDTIFAETKFVSDPGPPTRIYQVILGKTVSSGNDTIFYSVQVTRHIPPTINSAGSSTTAIENWSFTNLTDTVKINLPASSCIHFKTIDTVDYCGLPARIIQSVTDTFPCADGYHQYKIIEGLGVFTFSQTVMSGQNVGYYYNLVAAHKAGKNCGTIGPIPTGLSENAPAAQLRVYPNPSQGHVTVECAPLTEIAVYNAQGREVKYFQAARGRQQVRLDLPAGIYILSGMHRNKVTYHKLVVH